jgi:hypothetical protein
MLMGFIGHAQARRRESLRQLFGDDLVHRHVIGLCVEERMVERASFWFVKLAGEAPASS